MEDTNNRRREAQCKMTTMRNRKTDSGSGESEEDYRQTFLPMAVISGIIDWLRQLSIAQRELIGEHGSRYINVRIDV